jgi:hypothetical protein
MLKDLLQMKTTTSIAPIAHPRRRCRGTTTTPPTIYSFWFQLDCRAWSDDLTPVRAAFPQIVFDVFGWLIENNIKPMDVETKHADAIGFIFTNPNAAMTFKLRWAEYINHEGEL